MIKRNILFFVVVVLYLPESISGQQEALLQGLISGQPYIELLQFEISKRKGANFIGKSTIFSYDSSLPLVSLRLNRTQFYPGEMLEASARVIPSSVRNLPVNIILARVHPSSGEFKYYRWAERVISSGDELRIQTLLFDGTEKQGFYVLALFVYDEQGRLIAQPNTSFIFERLDRHDDDGYARIDSTEYIPGIGVLARGKFFQLGSIDQFLTVGGAILIPVSGNGSEMLFSTFPAERANFYLPAGNWDVVYIIKHPLNSAYDSRFIPGGVRAR